MAKKDANFQLIADKVQNDADEELMSGSSPYTRMAEKQPMSRVKIATIKMLGGGENEQNEDGEKKKTMTREIIMSRDAVRSLQSNIGVFAI